MKVAIRLAAFAAMTVLPATAAVTLTQRANITGQRGDGGKCTIEVNVDGVAEVQIFGDTGRLTTLAGQTATWARMICTSPLPPRPAEFSFHGVDGRGRQTLVADPRSNRGTAVIRIEDPQGGREGYTFDVEWRGGSGGPGGYQGGGGGGGASAFTVDRAMDICRDSVRDRANRDYGLRDLEITRIAADNGPGRNDWIIGEFRARRGRDEFRFSCSVDFSNGRVRSVDIRRR